MKSAALSPVTCERVKILTKEGQRKKINKLLTYHDRRRVRVTRRHLRHDARVGHPHASHSSDSQLIIDHGQRIVRRAHLARSRLMIFGSGVVTDRALPVSVAAELEMLAVLHGSSIELETVSKNTFPRETVKIAKKI